jgi:hypothetical protein
MTDNNVVIGKGNISKLVRLNGAPVGYITRTGREYYLDLVDPRTYGYKRIVNYGGRSFRIVRYLARTLLATNTVEEVIDRFSVEAAEVAREEKVKQREAAMTGAPDLQAVVDRAYRGTAYSPEVMVVDGHQRAVLLGQDDNDWIIDITLDSITRCVRIGLNAVPANLSEDSAEKIAFTLDRATEIKRWVERGR